MCSRIPPQPAPSMIGIKRPRPSEAEPPLRNAYEPRSSAPGSTGVLGQRAPRRWLRLDHRHHRGSLRSAHQSGLASSPLPLAEQMSPPSSYAHPGAARLRAYPDAHHNGHTTAEPRHLTRMPLTNAAVEAEYAYADERERADRYAMAPSRRRIAQAFRHATQAWARARRRRPAAPTSPRAARGRRCPRSPPTRPRHPPARTAPRRTRLRIRTTTRWTRWNARASSRGCVASRTTTPRCRPARHGHARRLLYTLGRQQLPGAQARQHQEPHFSNCAAPHDAKFRRGPTARARLCDRSARVGRSSRSRRARASASTMRCTTHRRRPQPPRRRRRTCSSQLGQLELAVAYGAISVHRARSTAPHALATASALRAPTAPTAASAAMRVQQRSRRPMPPLPRPFASASANAAPASDQLVDE